MARRLRRIVAPRGQGERDVFASAKWRFLLQLLRIAGLRKLAPTAALLLACGSLHPTDTIAQISSKHPGSGATAIARDRDPDTRDLESCHIEEVTSLPGSHKFGSDYIEAMDSDPDPQAKDANAVWGLTADLSSEIPPWQRAMYISKSTDGGRTWTEIARVDSKYFNAEITEGSRNALTVAPGGQEFVVTTQKGAFQILPRPRVASPQVNPIEGLKVPRPDPRISIPKQEGDPVTANVARISRDGKHLIVGYGYFDLHPQLLTYNKAADGTWVKDSPLPPLPTQMDLISMEFNDPQDTGPGALYVGTGDQGFRLEDNTSRWVRIRGVGPDSAIQGMSMVGGPHLAACWGVYNPLSQDSVERVTHASFLLHRGTDESGPNVRAYTIEVDPARPKREAITTLTGVYTSSDSGVSWKRLNALPYGEFRSVHFNGDGTIIVSGIEGTFLADPFSTNCLARLRSRDK